MGCIRRAYARDMSIPVEIDRLAFPDATPLLWSHEEHDCAPVG
jgi:hypothetical protein